MDALIEKTIAELNSEIVYAPQRGYFISDASAKHILRVAFDVARKRALFEACSAACADCAEGVPWYGAACHAVADTAPWGCEAGYIRALLPGAEEQPNG